MVRVGVLGGGVMAHTHLRSLLALDGVHVQAVAAPDVQPAVSERCAAEGIPVGEDLRWLLEEHDLEAVVVATPTDTHLDLVRRVAGARLAVFCEKPLARTAHEARAAIDACDAAGVKLAVGHVVRYFSAYAYIAQAVRDGGIGRPGMARCRRSSGPPGAARGWYGDAARSGGLILDMGVHDFDWLRWCLGPVQRVSALVGSAGHRGGELAMVLLAHENGALSSVELSWMDPAGFSTSVEVSGPGGLLRHDSRSSATFALTRWHDAGPVPASELSLPGSGDEPYRDELADAFSWFAGGPPPRCTALDGLAAVELAEAALLAARRRQPVVLGGTSAGRAR
jgi:predicted dehydrogenase